MDSLTSFAFSVVMAAVAFYILYWVIRKAVAGGINDATKSTDAGVRQPRNEDS